jgi:hypothetical protein
VQHREKVGEGLLSACVQRKGKLTSAYGSGSSPAERMGARGLTIERSLLRALMRLSMLPMISSTSET